MKSFAVRLEGSSMLSSSSFNRYSILINSLALFRLNYICQFQYAFFFHGKIMHHLAREYLERGLSYCF